MSLGCFLFSPAWPGGPCRVSRGRRDCDSGSSVWGLLPSCILASSGSCLLQKLIQDTAQGDRTLSYLFFFFLANDGSIKSSQSSRCHQPPQGRSVPAPACSQVSQRTLSCTKGESTGPLCQLLTGVLFSPESEKRDRL